jgi:hypothetical protein
MGEPRLGIVITAYQRPASLARLLASIRAWSPVEYAQGPVVIDQSCPPVEVAPPVMVLRDRPGFPGPRRRRGAEYVWRACPVAAILFLDDDAELLPTWQTDRPDLLARVLAGDVGLVSLPIRDGLPESPRDGVVGMCGGMLVRAEAYWGVGGHGEDYLDDVELSLRLRWAGWHIVRWHRRVSMHHGGMPGGLRALLGVGTKRHAHLRVSRLAETYPNRLTRCPHSWWGHREVRR